MGHLRLRFFLCRVLHVAALALSSILVLLPLTAHAASVEDAALFIDHQASPDWDVTATRGNSRVIEFDTDEGTWMSVDISPDGEWMVFDLLGHLYRMPASGGEARVLTQDSGAALNYHPRISPDGTQVAFVSDRKGQANLWVMDADGANPSRHSPSPSWPRA